MDCGLERGQECQKSDDSGMAWPCLAMPCHAVPCCAGAAATVGGQASQLAGARWGCTQGEVGGG